MMIIDEKSKKYFKNVKQIFLYLNDRCNLLCQQCLYKPNVIMGKSIPLDTAKSILHIFAKLGAFKLTILGGEISLFDYENEYKNLIELLSYAHELGYSYIRIDTNGQKTSFFEMPRIFEYIDEVSFSIDGYNSETNDILRGYNAFNNAINNLQKLKKALPTKKINITTCITKQNTNIAGGIKEFVEYMIYFANEIGIKQINFHGVFKMGVPMDTWTGDSHLDPQNWFNEIQYITQKVKNKEYPIDVRFPVHIIEHSEFEKHKKYYGYCPCKLGERALIHPDGIIRVCSSMLSTPYGVAQYNDNEICWNEYNNELQNHKMDEYTPCTNQGALYTETMCPVCFSLKPYQNEIVWNRCKVEEMRSE